MKFPKSILSPELCGYAAAEALKKLFTNWQSAATSSKPAKNPDEMMAGDIDKTIEQLMSLRHALVHKDGVKVEFDLAYFGGDYSDVGDFVVIPQWVMECAGSMAEAFTVFTGHPVIHIVHYTTDFAGSLSNRKFFRKDITVTVLSEDPIGNPDLGTITEQVTTGDWFGDVRYGPEVELNGAQLEAQASDPGFFRLTEEGEDAE